MTSPAASTQPGPEDVLVMGGGRRRRGTAVAMGALALAVALVIALRASDQGSGGASSPSGDVGSGQRDTGRQVQKSSSRRPDAGAPIYYNGRQRIEVLGRLHGTGHNYSSPPGRLDTGYVVGVSSTVEEDPSGHFFGVLDTEGRLTAWKSISSLTAEGFPWISPDGNLVLTLDPGGLTVRVAGSGKVLTRLR
jgi:hypothetical protein